MHAAHQLLVDKFLDAHAAQLSAVARILATAGLNRIKRLRKLHSIRCTHRKRFRVTTDSKHQLPIAENLLNRQFAPTAPNRVWVADITYIPTDEGWQSANLCSVQGDEFGLASESWRGFLFSILQP